MEVRLRNTLLKDALLAGRHMCYRISGFSLYPRMHSNDQTMYKPVNNADDVHERDIGICEVQLEYRFYAHLEKNGGSRGSGSSQRPIRHRGAKVAGTTPSTSISTSCICRQLYQYGPELYQHAPPAA